VVLVAPRHSPRDCVEMQDMPRRAGLALAIGNCAAQEIENVVNAVPTATRKPRGCRVMVSSFLAGSSQALRVRYPLSGSRPGHRCPCKSPQVPLTVVKLVTEYSRKGREETLGRRRGESLTSGAFFPQVQSMSVPGRGSAARITTINLLRTVLKLLTLVLSLE
jgi:hypothetical protein